MRTAGLTASGIAADMPVLCLSNSTLWWIFRCWRRDAGKATVHSERIYRLSVGQAMIEPC